MADRTPQLSEGESIIIEFKPHWSALWQEALVTVAFFVVIFMLGPPWNGWVFTILLVLWLWFAVKEFFEWWTTQHIVTSMRFIYRAGALRRFGYEIPLEVINDIAFRQGFIGRMLGVGDLLMETASTNGQSRLTNIPDPEDKKGILTEARKERSHAVARGGGAAPVAVASEKSVAEQLDILGRLLDEGKLSQEEYDEQKRKLMG
jgi:uncharacterized membrane protein YdbT with pleckstrin-like domain